MNVIPLFLFLTRYSRKTRLKLIFVDLVVILVSASALIGIFLFTGSIGSIFSKDGSMLLVVKCLLNVGAYALVLLPFLLLALIPKQSKFIDKIVLELRKEHSQENKKKKNSITKL